MVYGLRYDSRKSLWAIVPCGNLYIYIYIYVRIKGLETDIGLWAVSKDIKLSEDKQIIMRAYKSVVRERSLVISSWDCSPRRNTSLAKWGKGQKV